MTSRWISLKNKLKNKQNDDEIRKQFAPKNKLNNNNHVPNTFEEDKELKLIIPKNNDIKKDSLEEDDYNYMVYNKPISKYKIMTDEEQYYYNTISTFNSFELKKNLFFNIIKKINRFRTNNQDMDYIDFNSDLNLSFQARIKKNIFVKKKIKFIDKKKIFYNKIIRLFDKNNKMNNKKYNSKKYSRNNRNLFINKSKKNYKYNYYKNKNISKFSKKNKKKVIRKNFSSILESHFKVDSQNSNELIQRNNRIYQINENSNIKTKDEENIIYQKKEELIDEKINNIKSVSKNLFNKIPSYNQSTSSKSNQMNKNGEEYDKDKRSKDSNLYIGLNKPFINYKIPQDNNIKEKEKKEKEKENNYIISNNYNYNNRFRYSNRKSKSIMEDSLTNGNNNENSTSYYNDIIEKQSPKNIFQKFQIVKEEKIVEENDKEKKDKKFRKRYNFVNYNKSAKRQNIVDNIKNKDIEINNKSKNDIINYNKTQVNSRKFNISNSSNLIASKKPENNSSLLNNNKNYIPISINDKNVYNSNNIISKNYNHNRKYNNVLDKGSSSEITKIKLEKSINNSSQISPKIFPMHSKNNNSNNIDYARHLIKDNKKEINNNNYKNGYNKDKNKDNIINSKNYNTKPDIRNETKNNNNYLKNLLSPSNSQSSKSRQYISMIKPQINTDRNKGIRTERQIEMKRTMVNDYNSEKNNIINYSSNKSSYNLNIIKYINDEKNPSISINPFTESNKDNKYIDKIVNELENKYKKDNNKNDRNKNCLPQNKNSNNFKRYNHQYHEIKSEDNNNNITENDYNLFANKVKARNLQILNSTSMDNIRGIFRNTNDKDIASTRFKREQRYSRK